MNSPAPSLLVSLRRARWHPYLRKAVALLRTTLPLSDQDDYLAAEDVYRRWYATEDPHEAGQLRVQADERFSDSLVDVASAVAMLHFAVDRRWLHADELTTAFQYFADTPARVPAQRILAGVRTRPHPAPEELIYQCASQP